jgi:hypothetical protein
MKQLAPPSSGSFADRTASRNTYGQYVRARTGRGGTPVHSIASAVAAWQGLTPAQQLGWNAVGAREQRKDALGQTAPLSGAQRFISQFLAFTAAGQPPLTDPPPGTSSVAPRLITASATTTSVDLVFSIGEGFVLLDLSVPIPSSPGALFAPGRGQYWKRSQVAVASAGSISSSITASIGDWIQYRLVWLRPDGRRWNLGQGRVQVSASGPFMAFTSGPSGALIDPGENTGVEWTQTSDAVMTAVGMWGMPSAFGFATTQLYEDASLVLSSFIPLGTDPQWYWTDAGSQPLTYGKVYSLQVNYASVQLAYIDEPLSRSAEFAANSAGQHAVSPGGPGPADCVSGVVNFQFTT